MPPKDDLTRPGFSGRFRHFFSTEAAEPSLPENAGLDAFRVLFSDTGNNVGLNTVDGSDKVWDGDYRLRPVLRSRTGAGS